MSKVIRSKSNPKRIIYSYNNMDEEVAKLDNFLRKYMINTDGNLKEILELCLDLTINHDNDSNNVTHHIAVYKNAIEILHNLNYCGLANDDPNRIILIQIITYSSLLHDTIIKHTDKEGSKYNCAKDFSLSKKERGKNFCHKCIKLNNFLNLYTVTNTYCINNCIEWIIENMSFIREINEGVNICDDKKINTARNIVADADRIEMLRTETEKCKILIDKIPESNNIPQIDQSRDIALLEKGIEKCIIGSKNNAKEMASHYIRLLKFHDKYITTAYGKEKARSYHIYLSEYVNKLIHFGSI